METEKKQNLQFKTGEVIVVTEGCYSDFGIDGFVVAIKNFDMKPLAQEYAALPAPEFRYDVYDGFISWLVTKELVVPVSYRTVHLGDYSGFSDDFGVPEKD